MTPANSYSRGEWTRRLILFKISIAQEMRHGARGFIYGFSSESFHSCEATGQFLPELKMPPLAYRSLGTIRNLIDLVAG